MEKLKCFKEHNVNFHKQAGNQMVGDCPFCGKEKHFYASIKTGLWDCKVCGKKGNPQNFLYEMAMVYAEELKNNKDKLKLLSMDRGVDKSILLKYKLGWDSIGQRFTIPVFIKPNACCDIRLYKLKHKTRSSAGATSGLYGLEELAVYNGKTVYLCEGEWDTLAMRQLLDLNEEEACVVGVPGANTFKREWIPYFTDKDVYIIYDCDNAGELGEKIVKERLTGTASEIFYTHWFLNAPTGFDLRDWINYGLKLGKPKGCLKNLKKLFSTTPRGSKFEAAKTLTTVVERKEPENLKPLRYKEVVRNYTKWLHLPDTTVLDIMFGTIFANRLEGDPLWIFLVAPPGNSKSELLMSLSTVKEVQAMTSLTPHALISGAVWSNGKDPSLLPQLNNKVLVLKDFTTITSMHFSARDEIFGILRDIYDGKTEKYFGTGIKRAYKSKFGILAGVTPVIETFGTLHASLGERFLKFRIFEDTQETEKSKILKAISNINNELEMRRILCETAERCCLYRLEDKDKVPKFELKYLDKIVALAQFTAKLRGVVERDKYTQHVLYKPSTEIGTRLAKQFVKLAMGVGIFRGVPVLSEGEYAILKKVAKDTCPDRIITLIETLWNSTKLVGTEAMTTKELSINSNFPLATVFRILEDLNLLKLVDKKNVNNKYYWSLSKGLRSIIESSEVFTSKKDMKAKAKIKNKKLKVKLKTKNQKRRALNV